MLEHPLSSNIFSESQRELPKSYNKKSILNFILEPMKVKRLGEASKICTAKPTWSLGGGGGLNGHILELFLKIDGC